MKLSILLRYKNLILALVLILGSIILINNFLLTSTLKVEVSKAVSDQKITLRLNDLNGKTVATKELNKKKAANFRLPIGSFSVSAIQDDSETIGQAKTVRFKSSELKLDLEPQRAVSKIGSESLGCDIVVNNILYSYACAKESFILRHDRHGQFVNPTPILSSIFQLTITSSSPNGLLAKLQPEDAAPSLNIIDLANDSTSPIYTREGLDISSSLIVTDVANASSNQRFLAIDQNGAIYSYQNIQDKNPKKIELPDNKNLKASIDLLAKDYSLFNNKFLVYVGKTESLGDNPEAIKAQSAIERGFLYIADLGHSKPEFKIIESPKEVSNNDIQLIDDSNLALLKNGGLYVYRLDNNKVDLKAHFTGTNQVVVRNGGTAWFIRNNGVYKYNVETNQAIKVFQSTHLKPSQVFTIGDQVSFNAFIENDESNVLHSYLISDSAAIKPRLEDKLPYTSKSGLSILKMDYSDSQIWVQLALTSLATDKETRRVSYEQTEFDAAKQKVLERLKVDGFDLNKYQVFFTN